MPNYALNVHYESRKRLESGRYNMLVRLFAPACECSGISKRITPWAR